MVTIALYSGKISQMPGLIQSVKTAVSNLKSDLSELQKKANKVDSSVCDLSEVILSIRSSTQVQEDRFTELENFQTNNEDFIRDAVRIDDNAAETVNQEKKNFYEKYSYLKPDCEKSGWEKFCNGLKSGWEWTWNGLKSGWKTIVSGLKAVGEWCKDHWRLAIPVALASAFFSLNRLSKGLLLPAAVAAALVVVKRKQDENPGIWSFNHDKQGLEILAHWLYGNGKDLVFKDGEWGEYMKNNAILNEKVNQTISDYAASLGPGERKEINISTSAEIENGEDMIGYQYLHGTNADAGGFQIIGTIEKDYKGNVNYDLRCTWNDRIDPNFQYSSDKMKTEFANKYLWLIGANPKDYNISISWRVTNKEE